MRKNYTLALRDGNGKSIFEYKCDRRHVGNGIGVMDEKGILDDVMKKSIIDELDSKRKNKMRY